MLERFALYYAPPTAHPLWLRAAQWLGRDPVGVAVAPAEVPGIDTGYRMRISESARRYGFHATLKAPMGLAPGVSQDDLEAELRRFGPGVPPVSIGRLRIANLDGFLALIPVVQTDDLTHLVGRIVTAFEPCRAPLTDADREKRLKGAGYSPRQVEYLDRYGYPYVMEEFRFHMTLTDRLSYAERPAVLAAATSWFGPLLDESFLLDRIALFHETEAGAPFARLADFPLSARVKVDA